MNKKILLSAGLSFALFTGGFGLLQVTNQLPQTESAQAEVLMKLDSFEPPNLTIKKGTTVSFKNRDSKSRWPASNLHPTHEIYPEFDPQKPIDKDQSWQFRFDKAGNWKYHDHLMPYIRGVITVTD